MAHDLCFAGCWQMGNLSSEEATGEVLDPSAVAGFSEDTREEDKNTEVESSSLAWAPAVPVDSEVRWPFVERVSARYTECFM